jgi:hypothetical protein
MTRLYIFKKKKTMFGAHLKMTSFTEETRQDSMSYEAVVDAYAWIEYFWESEKGERTRAYIEGGRAVTPKIVISKFVRSRGADQMICARPQQLNGTLFEACCTSIYVSLEGTLQHF